MISVHIHSLPPNRRRPSSVIFFSIIIYSHFCHAREHDRIKTATGTFSRRFAVTHATLLIYSSPRVSLISGQTLAPSSNLDFPVRQYVVGAQSATLCTHRLKEIYRTGCKFQTRIFSGSKSFQIAAGVSSILSWSCSILKFPRMKL